MQFLKNYNFVKYFFIIQLVGTYFKVFLLLYYFPVITAKNIKIRMHFRFCAARKFLNSWLSTVKFEYTFLLKLLN